MNNKDTQLEFDGFAQIALYWLGFIWLAFGLALIDYFHVWILVMYLLGGVGYLMFATPARSAQLLRKLRPLAIPTAIILTVAIIAGYFATPTIFTGRDQGSIATAAIMLADTHARTVVTPASDAFFAHYGAGQALNFPGFFYSANPDTFGALVSGFSLPYISYLATFYSIFGNAGFVIANIILITLFALSLYLLVRQLLELLSTQAPTQPQTQSQTPTPAYLRNFPLIAVLATFPFLWFMKFTLTENLALFLVWTMILALVQLIRAPRTLWYVIFLLSGAMLVLTRIEGIAIFGVALLALLIAPATNHYLRARSIERLFIPLLAFILLFGIVFRGSIDFYKMVVKGFVSSNSATTTPDAQFSILAKLAEISAQYAAYLSYGMLPWVIVGAVSVWLIWRKTSKNSNTLNNRWLLLTPAIIIAPTFLYLIDANISPDAPWMLRRWTFTIVPFGIIYTTLLLAIWHQHRPKFAQIAAATLIAASLPATITFFTYSPHPQLLAQIAQLNTLFTNSDLVLIDGGATGDGFAMAPGVLRTQFGTHSAYFFNPTDFARVDFAQFDTVFLLVPNSNIAYYTDNLPPNVTLTPIITDSPTTTFTTNKLTPPTNSLLHLATKKTTTTSNTLFRVDIQSVHQKE